MVINGSGNKHPPVLKEVFSDGKRSGGTLRKNFCSFCVPLVKVYPKQRYSANSKNGGKKMEIQSKAMRMLRGLKGAGISYKQFAEKTGISLD